MHGRPAHLALKVCSGEERDSNSWAKEGTHLSCCHWHSPLLRGTLVAVLLIFSTTLALEVPVALLIMLKIANTMSILLPNGVNRRTKAVNRP